MSHINTLPIRIYYEDTDAGGVVYHARYIAFAERGRAEFLRDLGYESSKIEQEFSLCFVVRALNIEYLKPAKLDDLLHLKTCVTSIKNSSFVVRHEFFQGDEMIAHIDAILVCVSADAIKPIRMPDALRKAFEQ